MAETPDAREGAGDVPKPAGATADASPAVAPGSDPAAVTAPSKVEQAFGLWPRIKEHKILQWGLGYLGAALALAHGQELLAQAYDWPHSIGRIFMGLLIVGLPVVVTLAWYHGHKGLKRFSAAEMTIVALLLLIGGGGFFLFVHTGEPAAQPAEQSVAQAPAVATGKQATTKPPLATATEAGVSLAVLPFVNMSSDTEQEYFSDGLSEELLNQLAQIKDLRVAGRTSSFSFKGKNEDLRVIAEKLGVNHLLEGSVRKAGARLRITAQLINAADGSHLWSQSYDRELTDVFKVQEDIAKDVAEALAVTLGVGESARLEGQTTSLEAYDKYLRAGALFRNAASPADYARAAEMFHEALAIDPDFAPARGALAVDYALMLVFLPETSERTLKEMNETVKEALARAPDHWASHLANGVLLMLRQDWLGADAALAKARALAPSSESNGAAFSALFLGSVGRNGEALRVLEAARSADPLSPIVSTTLQQYLDMAGRPGDAQAEYERTKDLPGRREIPEHQALMRIWDSGDAAAIKAQARRFFDSEAVPMPVLNEVYEVFDQPQAVLGLLRSAFNDPAYQDATRMFILGWYAAHFGDQELALAAMRRGLVDMKGLAPHAIWYPVMREARKLPEFKDLVRDLGLVDYWRKSGNWGDFCHPLGTDDFECR